jgi:hypothetical protein
MFQLGGLGGSVGETTNEDPGSRAESGDQTERHRERVLDAGLQDAVPSPNPKHHCCSDGDGKRCPPSADDQSGDQTDGHDDKKPCDYGRLRGQRNGSRSTERL